LTLHPPPPVDPALDARDLKVVPKEVWSALDDLISVPDLQLLMLWELPTRKDSYYIGADVASGSGLDRSVADVVRAATLERPFEQVAQYISPHIDPVDFAYVLDTLGRFYSDQDGMEAQIGVETNNHGIATQSELERHIGYGNYYVWQFEDAAPGTNKYTKKIGWYTSRKTRPLLLTRYIKAVTTADPLTGLTDLVVNSPHTIEEMRDFQTEGETWEAEAGPGAFDDCIMSGAISYFIAQQDYSEGGETIAEQRRRLAWQKERMEILARERGQHRDYINTAATAEEMIGMDEDDFGGYDYH